MKILGWLLVAAIVITGCGVALLMTVMLGDAGAL